MDEQNVAHIVLMCET